ncbi:MAG TPA: cbb3-type cytochrome c oxidase subunit II [Minicystis sp.]|nr:cbb3-type cytochrome c oxidase subunit II [Minicystis sp.]
MHLSTIWAGAGLFCFGLAGVVTGVLPVAHLSKIPVQKLEDVAPAPSEAFLALAKRYPETFRKYYGEANGDSFRRALKIGRNTYIAEACWHCHSQFVRPVSNEDIRFGKVSWAGEYMNEMFLPHLMGTRRVGPDLIRESGKHANDWHVAHFYDPTIVVPTSVMPRYTWFYDGDQPNERGIGVITYVQWLGSWATPEALAHAEKAEEDHGDR